MSKPEGIATAGAAQPAAPTVPTSTYQLLRDRLHAVADRLQTAADEVNQSRAEAFATVPLALAEQDRLRTEQPSQPRDVIGLGDLLLGGPGAEDCAGVRVDPGVAEGLADDEVRRKPCSS